jgi:hypothetical protein
MKRTLTMLMLLAMTLSPMAGERTATTATYVYICTGGSSKRYHATSGCKGLSNCSGEIKKVTVNDAKKMGRTPCKMCFK